MDQIKQNPFLSTYVAVLVIGAGILGFLCFSSYGEYKEAEAEYDSVKSSVEGLKGKPIFPNEKNKKARSEEVTLFNQRLLNLEKDTAAYQPPANEITDPAALAREIRSNIEEVRSGADLAGVEIKDAEAFTLGMEGPLAILPREVAVPDLAFQLTAARKLVELAMEAGVTRIESVSREELASEAPPIVEDPRARRSSRTKVVVKEPLVKEGEVIKRYPVILTVTGSMDSIQATLNKIAATEDIFFSVRYPRIESERKVGPDKEGDIENLIPDPNNPGPKVHVVLGDEKISAEFHVDAIKFVSREEAEADKKAALEAAKERSSTA
jgi:hypothetical protein